MRLRGRLVLVASLLLANLCTRTLLARRIQADDESGSKRLARPLDAFPARVGDWFGVDEAAPAEVLAMMKLDDHLQRVYRHSSGQQVVLWISYSKTSRDQYHYPTVCMQGHGWTEQEAERTSQADSTGKVARTRFRFVKDDRGSQYVYYWYYLMGERGLDRLMRDMSRTARFFLRGRSNASVTVEIFSQSPVVDVALLDAFADRVAGELETWMPDGALALSQLGAGL